MADYIVRFKHVTRDGIESAVRVTIAITPAQALEEYETIVTTAIGLLSGDAIGMEELGVHVDDMLADTLEYDGEVIMEF